MTKWETHCSTDSTDYTVLNFKGSSIKLAKWQTEPFTVKVLQQLNDEPKVILSSMKNVTKRTELQSDANDHNVPDLCDGNSIEYCHEEIIYTSETTVKLPDDDFFFDIEENPNNVNKHDVEKELHMMFQDVIEEEEPIKKSPPPHREKRNKSRKSTRKLLIELFGSPLHDIIEKKPQKIQNHRRQSLPVSINITDDIFKPVKRKSETDIHNLSLCKVQKTVKVPVFANSEVFNVDYLTVTKLNIPPTYSETATLKLTLEEMKIATIMTKPNLGKTQQVTNTHIIDLTQDNTNLDSIKYNNTEIKAESSTNGLSMPSLSPTTPDQPIRTETVICERKTTSSPKKVVHNAQRRPNDGRVYSKPNVKMSPQQQQQPTVQKSILEQLTEWGKNQQSQSRVSVPNQHLPQKRVSVPNQKHLPQTRVSVPKQQPQQHLFPPQLLRLHQVTQPFGYHLVSNSTCGEKIFPYVYKFYIWKQKLAQLVKLNESIFSTDELKDNFDALYVYYDTARRNLARRLIKELLPLDVQFFSLSQILSTISFKMSDIHVEGGIYRICFLIHSIIDGCEEVCLTPFTKKFYNNIKSSKERMDERSREVFTSLQLKQLERQIREYHSIQNWIQNWIQQANRKTNAPNKRKATVILNDQNFEQQPKRNDKLILPKVLVPPPNAEMQSGQKSQPRETFRKPQNLSRPQTGLLSNGQEPNFAFSVPQVPNVQVAKTTSQETVPNPNLRSLLSTQTSVGSVSKPQVPDTTVQSTETKESSDEAKSEEVIDLTWIDNADEKEIYDEIIECKVFEFKDEIEKKEIDREVISPVDSGLGSPVLQTDDGFKCLCGNKAIFVCACQSSMYCSQNCQINDWAYHQRLCNKLIN
ncbi:uncharacterized protein LOC123003656 isoform X2 [Tribolium madens]|uniref:uncharacterized protein LOC123003656 isoform X2 n=1 Tax=Tribolium madens TaxID=41895 RepID=UPI001CF72024|nr:uncharacterized protein LOC123003656 isoform X2 [Tribolium madens]